VDEPVAWLFKRENAMPIITDDPDHKDGSWIPLYTAPQEPQKTIDKWIKANTEHRQWYICPKCSYQAPRFKDEWVGLTDDDIQGIHYQIKTKGMGAYSTEDIYHAIEAKLKEKNT
jgi:hypothetical protein